MQNTLKSITNTQGRIIILLLITGLIVPQIQRILPDSAPPIFKEPIPSWEYKMAYPSDYTFETELDKLGSMGWEMTFARRARGSDDEMGYECIFRRKKQPN